MSEKRERDLTVRTYDLCKVWSIFGLWLPTFLDEILKILLNTIASSSDDIVWELESLPIHYLFPNPTVFVELDQFTRQVPRIA